MLLLADKGAEEKIASFLILLASRLDSRDLVAVPMTRRDIADYLGLQTETVSRTLRGLHRLGVIALPTTITPPCSAVGCSSLLQRGVEGGCPLHIYIDQSGKASRELNVVGIPTTLLIDQAGSEIGRTVGPAEWDSAEVVNVIPRYLKGPTAARPAWRRASKKGEKSCSTQQGSSGDTGSSRTLPSRTNPFVARAGQTNLDRGDSETPAHPAAASSETAAIDQPRTSKERKDHA